MSLVGSLGDLGLGDILQIVSLSRKSGLLLLRSEEGEGRIVFRDGLVRAAFVKGEAEGLKELLVSGGLLDEAAFDRIAETAAAQGAPVAVALSQMAKLPPDRLDSLRHEHVERCVFAMFRWSTGEFSFEIRDEVDERDAELLLSTGINAQYLTMEATRLDDEDAPGVEADLGERDIEIDEIEFGIAGDMSVEVNVAGSEASPEQPPAAGPAPDASEVAEVEVLAEAAVRRVEQPEAAPDPPQPEPSARRPEFGSAILVDPDPNALEWQKAVFAPLYTRVHAFLEIDAGISRLRQYLRRGEEPTVLVSSSCSGDPMNGIPDRRSLIRRLQGHAADLPIFVICSGDESRPSDIAPEVQCLQRPSGQQLINRRARDRVEPAGQALREELRKAMEARAALRPTAAPTDTAGEGEASEDRRRVEQMSDRLRDPSAQGDVLALVVEFAAASFARVAVFMVRDDEARGIIQSGLARADGPGDEKFRDLVLAADEPAWFRAVLESRRAVKAPPADAGDHKLAGLLGSQLPSEAYVAPVESNGEVVALVYVDNLPAGAPIGDTAAFETVLQEAGRALDRALLERAVAESVR